jgi:tRNA(Ile2) C34 agmatinyltransferase TiaS
MTVPEVKPICETCEVEEIKGRVVFFTCERCLDRYDRAMFLLMIERGFGNTELARQHMMLGKTLSRWTSSPHY